MKSTTKPQHCYLLTEALEDWQDARAADKALAELERGGDSVISFEEWESQLNALED